MNTDLSNALQTLRQQGYAVIVFTPEELGDMNPRDLEEGLTSYTNNHLLPVDDEDDD